MISLIFGLLLIIIGLISIIRGVSLNQFYHLLKRDNQKEYIQTTGIVTCDAYDIKDAAKLNKPVTPIVEYKVNGKTYETQNAVLSNTAELPVGTKMVLWYKKDNPKQAILGVELNNNQFYHLLGAFLITIGLLLIIIR